MFSKEERMPFKRGLLGFVFVSTALLLLGCGEAESVDSTVQTKAEKPLLPVEFIKIKKEKVPIWMRFNGTTKASNEQTVQARTKGRLTKVYFEAGQFVKKGDKLYEIERSNLESQYNASKANLKVTEAKLQLAEADLARYAPLARDGLIPKQKYEQQKAQVASLKATVEMNKATLSGKETDLKHSTIIAPISGIVSRTLVDEGNLVGYDGPTKLTTIIADDPMYAYFNPSEEDIQLIRKYREKKKMDALVIIPTKNKKLLGDRRVRGTVDFSNSLVDAKTSTITSRVIFPNPNHEVFPGTFVYVTLLVTSKIDLLVVPKTAIQRDQIAEYVFVINDKDQIERRNIDTGYETKQFKVIRKGVKNHERIVVNNFIKVKKDMKVAPVDMTDKKGVMAVLKEKNLLSLDTMK